MKEILRKYLTESQISELSNSQMKFYESLHSSTLYNGCNALSKYLFQRQCRDELFALLGIINELDVPNGYWLRLYDTEIRLPHDNFESAYIKNYTQFGSPMVHIEKCDGKCVKMKLTRFINRQLEGHLPTIVIQRFIDLLKARVDGFDFENKYRLQITDDIGFIYDATNYLGNENYSDIKYETRSDSVETFGSCMASRGRDKFYDSVDCSGAVLLDENDRVVSRCVIFNKVKDTSGNVYRMAERQYSYRGDVSLHNILLQKLISGGHIDIYKSPYVRASDANDIFKLDGTSLYDTTLFIDLKLSQGNTISYQDTFKYYCPDSNTASNRPKKDRVVLLNNCSRCVYWCEDILTNDIFVSYDTPISFVDAEILLNGNKVSCKLISKYITMLNMTEDDDGIWRPAINKDAKSLLSMYSNEDEDFDDVFGDDEEDDYEAF